MVLFTLLEDTEIFYRMNKSSTFQYSVIMFETVHSVKDADYINMK